MSAISTIEWTDATWNPTRGCSIVSAGCTNCYAMKQGHRFSGPGKPYDGLTRMGANGPTWTGKVRLVPEALDWPIRYRGHPRAKAERRPTRIFVNSMSDLFHEHLSSEGIATVFAIMAACPHHTFQILTKRPDRMLQWFQTVEEWGDDLVDAVGNPPNPTCSRSSACTLCLDGFSGGPDGRMRLGVERWNVAMHSVWPLPNVHIGVSVEDQATADERIPLLLQTPAAVRFVSYEPALGPVQFGVGGEFFDYGFGSNDHNEPRVHWLIVGGESGPRARPCDVEWIRSAVRQCREASVPVFVKQLGSRPIAGSGNGFLLKQLDPRDHGHGDRHCRVVLRDSKGGDLSEWPDDLRVREFPALDARADEVAG